MSRTPPVLVGSDRALTELYDVALLDLDGVVYLGQDPVPRAAAALARARAAGMRLAYVTNNASRRPDAVVALLADVGVPAQLDEVITSAQAAAHLLAERLDPGAAVLIVGSEALAETVTGVGLRAVRSAEDAPVAVVQGFGPDVGWSQLAEAAVAIRRGAWFVATNTDASVPSPRGPLPGNGVLVEAVAATTKVAPFVVGKPEFTLHREAVERAGAQHPLVVGDRLDTDIEGAVGGGADSLLVFTGVTDARALLGASVRRRPTYVADDLTGLLETHPDVAVEDATARCRRVRADRTATGVAVAVAGDGVGSEDPEVVRLDVLRAVSALTWATREGDDPVPDLHGVDDASTAALNELGLL